MTEQLTASADGSEAADGIEAADGEDEDKDEEAGASAREIDRRPAPLSAVFAIAASAIAAIAASVGSPAGAAIAGLGVVLAAAGALVGSRRAVDAAGLALLGGIVVAGVGSIPELWALVATVAAVLAWDLGHNAISLGEQLGRDADTAPAEIAHMAATLAVGASTAAVAYVLYLLAGGDQPISAVVFLLVAVALLVGALR